MRNGNYKSLFVQRMMRPVMFSLLFLVEMVSFSPVHGAPVIPNESLAAAEVLELTTIHSSTFNINPPQMLSRMKLRLLSVQDGAT
jgi:hypothetical protein